MKVLFLTLHDQTDASSQIRVYQFIKYLEEMKIECTVKPFLSAKTEKDRNKLTWILKSLFQRFSDVISARNYDAVVVQKDVLPFGLQSLLYRINQNIIYEFDDAIWEISPKQKQRSLLMQLYYQYNVMLFHKILKRAKMVLTNNSYQAQYAKNYNNNVNIITAPIDTELYKQKYTNP